MKKSLVQIILALFLAGFQLQAAAEDTKLRVTLNVNAYGRSVAVSLNGIEIRKVAGGLAQAIQLYHEKHPLLKEAPEDFKDNFCLKQGKNTIKIVHYVKKGEIPMTLDISMQAIGYSVPLLQYTQKTEVSAGETSGIFELHSRQPEGFKTIVLE
ncbi:MAG: hypothetical protein JXI33_00070 [Candidatus Aminicenantes bacterium]|nr:hypothetical protein [Candidatus Aminicenantes bacterium]